MSAPTHPAHPMGPLSIAREHIRAALQMIVDIHQVAPRLDPDQQYKLLDALAAALGILTYVLGPSKNRPKGQQQE